MTVRMKGFHSLTPVEEAVELLLSKVKPLGTETVAIEKALGRVLAQDVSPEDDIPPFDRAAMDGYAVHGEDTFKASETTPVTLKLIGEVMAGASTELVVGEREAVRISTGATVPSGANAVVMLEYTQEKGEEVEVLRALPPGKNVSSRGEDAKKGERLLEQGAVLRPQDIAILAAMGKCQVEVYKRPSLAVLSSGDELVEPGMKLAKGEIYDSNSYSLSALVEMNGGIGEKLGIVRDTPEDLKDSLKRISSYDALLVSGATSVGGKDLIPAIVEELGEILVHGVSMRPGKPAGFGLIGGKLVFMLPGSPVAAMFAFDAFVRPAMQKMQGCEIRSPYPKVKGTLQRKIASHLGRRDFVRVRIDKSGFIEPVSTAGAGVISTMVKAEGFVVVPESLEGLKEGAEVEVHLFRI